MSSPHHERLTQIETRLAQVEYRMAADPALIARQAAFHPAWALALALVGLACAYLGLGLPQHYYQPLFAVLFLLLGYHRGWWHLATGAWRWPLVVVNFALLCLLFKLLLGGGLQYPMDWLKVPTFVPTPESGGEAWYRRMLPNYELAWRGVPGVSDWTINMTKVQSLLLLATLAGALFRFQPFASLTALALLLVSFPSYLSFNWDWVILFLVLGGTALYLQTASPSPSPSRRVTTHDNVTNTDASR